MPDGAGFGRGKAGAICGGAAAAGVEYVFGCLKCRMEMGKRMEREMEKAKMEGMADWKSTPPDWKSTPPLGDAPTSREYDLGGGRTRRVTSVSWEELMGKGKFNHEDMKKKD